MFFGFKQRGFNGRVKSFSVGFVMGPSSDSGASCMLHAV